MPVAVLSISLYLFPVYAAVLNTMAAAVLNVSLYLFTVSAAQGPAPR